MTLTFPVGPLVPRGHRVRAAAVDPARAAGAVPRRRDREPEPEGSAAPPRPWHSVVAAALGVTAVATVVAGPVGTGVTLLVAATAFGLARWRGDAFAARFLVGTAGVSPVIASVLLSTGPCGAPPTATSGIRS
ncbi:hypothetical protein GS831_14635 [Rhodococcus hoagii]|nr:hypothetical protein [Prescottella equi]